jgi:hypothetical protein
MSEQINKILMDIHKSQGSMEAKLDSMIERLDDHENKISGLEKLKIQALTVIGVVTFVGTFTWDWIKVKVFGA